MIKLLIYFLVFGIALEEVAVPIGDSNNIRLVEILNFIFILFYFKTNAKIIIPKMAYILFCLCGVIFLGVFFAPSPFAVIAKDMKIFFNVVGMICLANYISRYSLYEDVYKAIKVVTFFECIFAFVEYVFLTIGQENVLFHATQSYYELVRVDGTFTDANYLGWFLACSCIVFFSRYLLKSMKKIDAIIWWFTFGALLLTLSRSSLLACLTGMSCIFLVYSRHNIRLLIKSIIFFGVIFVCVFLILDNLGVLERYTTMMDLERGDVYVRIVLYVTAIDVFLDNIFLGVGAGNYMSAMGEYARFTGATMIPHNSFLEIASETGVFSLGLMVYFFYTIICLGMKYVNKWLVLNMLGITICIIICGMFYSNTYYQYILYFYIALGLSEIFQYGVDNSI